MMKCPKRKKGEIDVQREIDTEARWSQKSSPPPALALCHYPVPFLWSTILCGDMRDYPFLQRIIHNVNSKTGLGSNPAFAPGCVLLDKVLFVNVSLSFRKWE